MGTENRQVVTAGVGDRWQSGVGKKWMKGSKVKKKIINLPTQHFHV